MAKMNAMIYLLLGLFLLAHWSAAECPEGLEVRSNECQDINECSGSGERRCDQLCANEPGTFRCGCLDNYLIGSDNTSCLVDGPDPVIYFRRRKDIARMDPSGLHPEVAARRVGSVRSFDVHHQAGTIYWIDSKGPTIGMTPIGGRGQIEVFNLENLMKPETLKIDWIRRMIYWTDSKAKTISRCSMNGTDQQTILDSQKRPKALVLDPVETFIFWSTSGKYGRIYRADFDGRTRDALVKNDLSLAVSLDVDIIDKRLYWLDPERGVIESVNYQGSDRMVIVEGISTEGLGLSLLADSIYWMETDPPAIHRVDRRTGRRQIRIRSDYFLPGQNSLVVMHDNKQPDTHEFYHGDCTTWNNCQEFPHSRKVPRNSPFVLFATNHTIRKINQDGSNYAYVLDNQNVVNLVGVDYDVREERVYFADAGRSVIESIRMDGSDRRVVVDHERIGTVEGIVLDWMHRKLYWTDSSLQQVAMVSLFRGNSKIIANEDVYEPRGITIHPTLNWVYWTDIRDGNATIFASQHDGSYRRAVISSGLSYPNDVTIDFARNRLVWVDYGLQVIEQSSLEGLEREVIYRIAESGHSNLQPHSVAAMNNFLWYTNWKDDTVVRIDTRDNDLLDIVGDDLWRPSGIQAVDPRKNRKRPAPNPCRVFNGLCEQICNFAAANQVICMCQQGYRLHEDHRSCVLADPCLSGHHECADNSRCISDNSGGYHCLCDRGLQYNMTVGCIEMREEFQQWPDIVLTTPKAQDQDPTTATTTSPTPATEAPSTPTDAPHPVTTEEFNETTSTGYSTTRFSEGHGPCPHSHRGYCLNGGQCRWLVELDVASCLCHPDFIGDRCRRSSVLERFFSSPMAVAVSGGVILPLCFSLILLAICLICRRMARSKESSPKRDGVATDVFYRRSSSYQQSERSESPVSRPSQNNIQMETIDRTPFDPDNGTPTEEQFSTFPRRAPSSSKNNNNSTVDDIAVVTASHDQWCDIDDDVQVPGDYEDMSQDACSSYISMNTPACPKEDEYMNTIERHYNNTAI